MSAEDEQIDHDETTVADAIADSAVPSTSDSPAEPAAVDEIDLDAMTADLDGVDAALARLADGTYWTDEVTGEPIPASVLESDPIARRA